MNGNRTVVVTGATSGVGRAAARAFARQGDTVALLARGREGLEGAAREIRLAGGRALPIQVDVADAAAVDDAATQVEDELGPIDVWVNDAMTTVFAEFVDIEPDEFRRAAEVTFLGSVWGTRAALRRMLPRDSGTIVQVGSALAFRGIPLQSAYCASKHALAGFVESVRCELRHRGSKVHLTAVHLPGLNTPQFDHCRSKMPNVPQPVPPIFLPEVAADGIVWASKHRRRAVYVGLPTVLTIFGNRVSPLLAEIYLARTAYGSQQTTEAEPGVRAGNLFEPVPGDPGAHGRFDARSHDHSIQLAWTKHRVAAGVGALAAGAAAGAARIAVPRLARR